MHLELSKWYWKRHLASGDIAIDATCGNGLDTLYLAKLDLSNLFALDIQQAALIKTEELLSKNLNPEQKSRVVVCQMSHDDLASLPFSKPPSLIVYNLGYLPGGDKAVTTKVSSTLKSVESALNLLGEKGALSVTCYPGHEEGRKETEALLDFVKTLKDWDVIHHLRPNKPLSPSLLWIARRASDMR